jgi:GTP-binding protein EngB required for normal cell division
MSAKSSFLEPRIEITRFRLYLERLDHFYQVLNLPEKSDGIKQLAGSISPAFIELAIIGQFKAGKSSFINSILNDSVLPTGIVPVTSVITRIQYGDHPEIIIKFLDGHVQTIKVENLFEYCSEKSNPGNIKRIDVIDVFHPSLKEYKNLRIVDTPGLGSSSEGNTETTLTWINKAGYALLVIGCERPISSSDLILLDHVKTICPKIYILLTKLDLIKEDDQSELFQYFRDKIKNHSPDDILPVFGYSVINNFEKYRKIIFQEVLKPIQDYNAEVIHAITRHKTITHTKECIDYTQIVLQNFKKFRNQEHQVLDIIDEINKNKDHYKKELLYSTSAFKNEVRSWLEKIYLPYNESFIQSLTIRFNHDFQDKKGILNQITHWFENWLKDNLKEELQISDQQSLSLIDQFLSEKAGFYSLFLKSFKQSYKKFVRDLYDFDITGNSVEVSPILLKPPDISVSRIFESQLDLFFFFMPVSIIKPWVRKYYINQIVYEVDKNIRRHISILTEGILIILDSYYKYTYTTIQDELKVLEKLISSKVEAEKPYQDMLNELNEMINQLNQDQL